MAEYQILSPGGAMALAAGAATVAAIYGMNGNANSLRAAVLLTAILFAIYAVLIESLHKGIQGERSLGRSFWVKAFWIGAGALTLLDVVLVVWISFHPY